MHLQQIQQQIIQLARSKPYITVLDIEHLGSKGQVRRARRNLRLAGKIETDERIQIGNSTYSKIAILDRGTTQKKAQKWPCGTPKSTGNAFDWNAEMIVATR